MTYLPDINIWIALAVVDHVHHEPAVRWINQRLDRVRDEIAFCRVTQMGFLRLLTSPRVMGSDALTAAQAWGFVERLRKEKQITFAYEPLEFETKWREATRRRHPIGANFWTGASLLAFADTAGYALATFDRSLAKRAGVQVPA